MSYLAVRLETVIQMFERGLLCKCEVDEKEDLIKKHDKNCPGKYRVKRLLAGDSVDVLCDAPGSSVTIKLER